MSRSSDFASFSRGHSGEFQAGSGVPAAFLAILIASTTQTVHAQCGTWVQVAGPSASPQYKYGAAMAYDAVRGKTVLYGGYDYRNTFQRPFCGGTGALDIPCPSRETWEWDGTTWTLTDAQGPARLSHAAMAYNPSRGRVQMFGGRETECVSTHCTPWDDNFGRLYEWTGQQWELIWSPTNSNETFLTARDSHSMVFDAEAGVMRVQGGLRLSRIQYCGGTVCVSGENTTLPGPSGVVWDGATFAAMPQVPLGRPTVRERIAPGLLYDPRRQRTLLVGGHVVQQVGCISCDSYYSQETWAFDGTAWTRLVSSDYAQVNGVVYHAGLGVPFKLRNACHPFCEGSSTYTFSWEVGSSRVDLQACKLEYSIVSPK